MEKGVNVIYDTVCNQMLSSERDSNLEGHEKKQFTDIHLRLTNRILNQWGLEDEFRKRYVRSVRYT